MTDRFEAFTMLITKIKRNISRLKSEEMTEFNLKSSHVNCLYYISRRESLTATELCELCGEDKAAISRALSYLEKCKLISCESSAAQKRYNTPLSLTAAGKAVAARLSERIARILEEASIGLDDESRRIMYESLEIISKNLEKININ